MGPGGHSAARELVSALHVHSPSSPSSPPPACVQSLSRVRLFVTPWTAAHQASLSITNSRSLLKLMPVESVIPSNHLILCPLLLLPSIFPSIRAFSNQSVRHIRWPKYWSFSFNIIPSSEYSGLISFRMDWLDLLAVQGTLKSLLQHQSSKALILQRSTFFIVQLFYPYMTTRKTIALTIRTFAGQVMSLLFNMLSRLVRLSKTSPWDFPGGRVVKTSHFQCRACGFDLWVGIRSCMSHGMAPPPKKKQAPDCTLPTPSPAVSRGSHLPEQV